MTDIRTSADRDRTPTLTALAEAQAELDQYGPDAPSAQQRVQACATRPAQPVHMDDILRAFGCDV